MRQRGTDIVSGWPDEAKEFLDCRRRRPTPYMDELHFEPRRDAADPDTRVLSDEQLAEAEAGAGRSGGRCAGMSPAGYETTSPDIPEPAPSPDPVPAPKPPPGEPDPGPRGSRVSATSDGGGGARARRARAAARE